MHGGEDLIQASNNKDMYFYRMDSRKWQLSTANLFLTYEKSNKSTIFLISKYIFSVVTPRDLRLDTDDQEKHCSPIPKEGRKRLINKLECYEGNTK
jgi:hypothetical protein